MRSRYSTRGRPLQNINSGPQTVTLPLPLPPRGSLPDPGAHSEISRLRYTVPASATATMSASHVSVADSLATYKAQLAALRGSAYSPRDARKALDLMHAAIELSELARRGHVDKSDIIAAVQVFRQRTGVWATESAQALGGAWAPQSLRCRPFCSLTQRPAVCLQTVWASCRSS